MGSREQGAAPDVRAPPLIPAFDHFVAIDWSGATGERHAGIAVALAHRGDAPPQLVRPGHRWSRGEVLAWLAEALPPRTLVGLDLGASLPFADCGAFFPGWAESPADALGLWTLVDRLCAADPHLGANGFVDHAEAARHFRRHGARRGALFSGRGRLRVTEQAQARAGLRPYSNLNLVGAAQVGKASLTGMRVLQRLRGVLPVWPFDPIGEGSLIVEIYTSLAAREAGRPPARSKMRDAAALDAALAALGCGPSGLAGPVDDHRSDAIVAAAWLRVAAPRPSLWHPRELTEEVARTEGWTFGIA